MKIIVFIKQVPATTNVRLDPVKGTMIRGAAESETNPLDVHAVFEAVKIKEQNPGSEVIALTMGPASAVKVLQEAVARGVDKGILLSSKAFAGSDTLATSRILAAAVRRIGAADLILAGEKAIDGETGQTGPMTAALLGIPVATFVRRIEVRGSSVYIERAVEEGIERNKIELPVLLTVMREINRPGLPSLRGVLAAKKAEYPIWGPEGIGIPAEHAGLRGSPTRVVKVFSPKLARDTIFYKIDENRAGSLNAVIGALKKRRLL